MTEQTYAPPAAFQVTRVPAAPPLPALDPRFKALLLALRQASFIVGDACSDILGMPRRKAD